MMEQPGRILDGNLETLGLPATLKVLALGGKTGILNVTSGQERLRIALQNGHIAAMDEPGQVPPDLIEIFRLLGRIPRARAAELRQAAGHHPNTAMAILTQWGVISPEEYNKRMEFGVIQALSRAVRWERGRFEFLRDVSSIESRQGSGRLFNVDHVLLEALRMADERDHSGALSLTRNTVARWMAQFQGDVQQMGLGPEQVGVLCLSNGQLSLAAIAYGMLLPEARVAATMQRLLDLGLIELVDARLESELERSLVNLLTQSQHQLAAGGRTSPEQRMLALIRTMGSCINGLLTHHGLYARMLRGRGEVPRHEVFRHIEQAFRPKLQTLQHKYPRMDEIIRFESGRLDYHDVETLDRVVRGQELLECYWDGVRLLFEFMQRVFEHVLNDETGHSRAGRQYEELWAEFVREIDEEIKRLAGRHAAMRV